MPNKVLKHSYQVAIHRGLRVWSKLPSYDCCVLARSCHVGWCCDLDSFAW
jgi:hypothetical protein